MFEQVDYKARRLFERHPGETAEGFAGLARKLKGFNAYAFSVLADRGYDKVKDRVEHTGADGAPLEVSITFVKSDGST